MIASVLLGVLVAEPAEAKPSQIDVPAGMLADALKTLSRQGRISVAAEGALPRIRVPAVKGRLEPEDALQQLLVGSGWRARRAGPSLWQLVRFSPVQQPQRVKPPPSPAPPPAQDIVVTALKRDLELSAAPVSIAVVPGDRFSSGSSSRGSSDLPDEVGSVFSTHMGPGKERLFLRGVADSPFNGPTQSTVGLFLDDARINYALPDPDLRLVDIERVEVLRGPQGTLYGSGSLGGVVRIVTVRPKLDQFSGNVAFEGSAVTSGGAGGAVEATLNLPIVNDSLGVRASAYADYEGGWIDDAGQGRTNVNSSHRVGGRLNLRWKPDDDWIVDLSLVAQKLESRDAAYATDGLSRSTAIAQPSRNDFFLFRLEAKGPIGDLDFLSSTAIESNHATIRYDASSVADLIPLASPVAYDEKRSVYLITQEFRLSQSRGAFRWLAGTSIVDAINVNLGTFTSGSGAAVEARAQANLNLEAAFFTEGMLALTPSLDLTAGIRAFVSNIWDDPRSTSGPSIDQYGLSPSAALAWRPAPEMLLWIRYASAVRPGGRNLDGAGELVTFQSDKLKNLELGSRLSLLDGHLDLDLTAFALRWHDVQSDRVGRNGLVVTTNVGNATNYGVEFGARGSWRDLALELSFTGQHGRLSSAQTAGIDLRLPVLPDLSGRARLNWERQIGDWAASAYLSANYWGRTRLGFDPAYPLDMPTRWVLGSGLSLGRDSWRAILSVSNLLDSRANSFSFGNSFTFRSQAEQTPLQPRTFLLRLERNF
ncbi:TonB-dependent receptor [Sphingobium sp. BHU LFT2]|uniref:TonB-dependent receptor n=1 Tax=Sphingobium sp. BHU LFT2 TaxID=2807634 RepID=UPI001BEB5B42|nr:TonB-dependent receptor [Sphingobium sp. BHU LFT2]MBT2246754.1 TonB-dependent receptor [Sphingobium sp. BHU LFT2]